MDITYLGHSSFRLKGKTAVVVTDPFNPKEVGLKYPKQPADIVTVSHDHFDHNYLDSVKDYRKVVSGPGEYEIQDVSIIGIDAYHDDVGGEERGKNTVYIFEMDGIRLCHLGDLGHKLSEKILEDVGNIDVLMVPVGGVYTIDEKIAGELVRSIEPKITIPMHYQVTGLNQEKFSKLKGVEEFLAETGIEAERLDKLSIKESDLGDEKKVVVLTIKQ
jgi:L-ascorbate metabolism protein UlaG (beta-lactamase superfamily)